MTDAPPTVRAVMDYAKFELVEVSDGRVADLVPES